MNQMALCILMKTNDATLIKLTKKNNHVYERKPNHGPKIRTSDEMDVIRQVPAR